MLKKRLDETKKVCLERNFITSGKSHVLVNKHKVCFLVVSVYLPLSLYFFGISGI